jgi:aspartate carbamoyltransferase catalytic subunit
MLMHILSAEQFNKTQIKKVFDRADYFKARDIDIKLRREHAELHKGRQVATLFFQPSTRTRVSFETAATKLGIGVISTENALGSSSAVKGETIEDTIKVFNGYNLDAVIMRYHEVGGAKRAAAVSQMPIINAGDGPGEHPTQSLLDSYTILDNHGRLDNLRIVFGGDLKYSRTMRSLSLLLSKYEGNHITFVSIPEFQVADELKDYLRKAGAKFHETDDMKEAFKDADIIYWTRLQKEYIDDAKLPSGGFVIDKKIMDIVPKKATIMHALPRVDEITSDVDDDPRAKYFEQAGNGLYVRMALLDLILTDKL